MCLYTSVLYGLLYGTLAAFPFVWQGIRGRSPQYASVTYLSLLGGFTLGAVLVGCLLQDRQFKREYDEGRSTPESRIGPATWIGFLVPVGLFLFAWTAPFDCECSVKRSCRPLTKMLHLPRLAHSSPGRTNRHPLRRPMPGNGNLLHGDAGHLQLLAVVCE